MNAESEKRINELVEEAKQAVADFRNTHPQWYGDDPEGATMEAVANELGENHKSFVALVAADPALASQEVDLDGESLTSLEHVAWTLVYREVLKRVRDSVATTDHEPQRAGFVGRNT